MTSRRGGSSCSSGRLPNSNSFPTASTRSTSNPSTRRGGIPRLPGTVERDLPHLVRGRHRIPSPRPAQPERPGHFPGRSSSKGRPGAIRRQAVPGDVCQGRGAGFDSRPWPEEVTARTSSTARAGLIIGPAPPTVQFIWLVNGRGGANEPQYSDKEKGADRKSAKRSRQRGQSRQRRSAKGTCKIQNKNLACPLCFPRIPDASGRGRFDYLGGRALLGRYVEWCRQFILFHGKRVRKGGPKGGQAPLPRSQTPFGNALLETPFREPHPPVSPNHLTANP